MSHKEERGMNGTGRSALVTGAGTGIGKRTALLRLEAGYSVVLVGCRVEPLEQTVEEAGVSNSRTLVMFMNVSSPEAVSALFAA
jgi:NAD(P)-dependent dehydrogenase (short-subunit alcohol dehydrogenase family)